MDRSKATEQFALFDIVIPEQIIYPQEIICKEKKTKCMGILIELIFLLIILVFNNKIIVRISMKRPFIGFWKMQL